MRQPVKVPDRRAAFDSAHLGLGQAEPPTKPFLADGSAVVRVHAVRHGHQPDVLSSKGVAELIGVPELVRELRRLVLFQTAAAQAASTTGAGVVACQTASAGVAVPAGCGVHISPYLLPIVVV
ncbi:hypothetical protein BL253_32855 [Pseudofrankia asymbiotica]|uniref:Uncharacterized protein n=1 Tax=Pseudofrankia asymbiotica TaxID=1834516 RepID=A0A1V2I179_9ACTN|nr:hypothetical protein BL253_32855 [Pseudofrankia asymbiotica]